MNINSISALLATKNVNFQKSFKGQQVATKPIEQDFQITIPDILTHESHLFQNVSGKNKQNPAFCLDVKPGKYDGRKLNYEINIPKYNSPAVLIQKDKTAEKLPRTQFKIGKFGPTIELIDEEIGIKIQMLGDSQAKMLENLKVVIPNQSGKSQFGITKDITFSGKTAKAGGGELQVVTFYKEQATKDAVDAYINDKGKLYNQVVKGDFIQQFQENKPNVMVLAGGFGTRLFNLTGADSNKPALKLPTRESYRLMANALDLASKSGMITDAIKGTGSNLVYLTGANTIKGDNVRDVIQQTNLGDGGCIAKALFDNKTATDVPLIILNADTFTNADITRAYKAYLDHPDAALLIPFYESSLERAKGFGLIGINNADKANGGVQEIKKFIEKPEDPLKQAKEAIVAGTKDKFMANPGIYIISPVALRKLKAMGDGLNKELGLAKNFVTPLVNACQEGEFLDDNNNPMKCYTVKLEKKGGGAAYWDDLGLDVAIPQTFRDMAKETVATSATSSANKYFGMPTFVLKDAVNNTDLQSGLVFMNDSARDKYSKFVRKYPGFQAKGNVIVYDSAK